MTGNLIPPPQPPLGSEPREQAGSSDVYSFLFLFFKMFYFFIYAFFLLHSIVTQLHIHVYILFSRITCSIISDSTEFPVLHSRIPLLIHPKGNILHLFTPSSQSLPLPALPPWQQQIYCQVHDFLFCGKVPLCHILDSRYVISYENRLVVAKGEGEGVGGTRNLG